MSRHDTIKQNILILVEKNPEVKNNYSLLVMEYWKMFDNVKSLSSKNRYTNITSPEAITRCFRKLVEQKMIKLSPYVIKIRMEEEETYRKLFR